MKRSVVGARRGGNEERVLGSVLRVFHQFLFRIRL